MIVDKIHKITFASSTSANTTNEQASSATSGRATYYGDNVDGGNPAAIVADEGEGVVEAEVEAEAVGHATALPPYSAATTGLRTRHHHLSTTQIRTSWDIEHRSHVH